MNRSQHAQSLLHQLGPQAALFDRPPGLPRKILWFLIASLIGLAMGTFFAFNC